MKTRPLSRNARLSCDHVATFREVLSGGKLSDDKETYLIVDGPTNGQCSPIKANCRVPRIAPFMGQRQGHVAPYFPPGGKDPVKLKLVEIAIIVPEGDDSEL